MAPVKISYSDDKLRVAVDEQLCVARWTDTPDPNHFGEVLRGAQSAAVGRRAVLFNVVDAPGKLPRFSDEVRRAAQRMSEGLIPITKVTAHVILMDGFTGATVRMFLSTLTLLTRNGAPTKVFSALDEGSRWLSPHLTERATSERIEAAHATLR